MKRLPLAVLATLLLVPLCPAALPRLEPRGAATQLIVDDQPWLILGGELSNTVSSHLPDMEPIWPQMSELNLNTVLVAVAWAWVEPEEGKFDFSLVDGLLEGARRHDQRVIFLWFGSWKNGLSSFVPGWVKADQSRFPRARIAGGRPVEILSPFSDAARTADTRAYTRFVEHLAQVDPQHTVVMLQLQNEVGILGDSRDRSPAAEAAFNAAVPAELLSHLVARRDQLSPALAQLWQDAGSRTQGTWTEVFGATPATDELFMAWHFARYMNHMAAAGKAVLPLPVFTNTWIVQPEDRGPGDYPSGGPQPLSLNIWKAGAPAIDLNCPDIYLPDFERHVAAFHRPDNPLFVPESRGDAAGAAQAVYTIGAHAGLGYSPFGIDRLGRLVTLRPTEATPTPRQLADVPLARTYALLRDLSPLILEHQAAGTIDAALLRRDRPAEEIILGDYRLQVELRRSSRDQSYLSELGYALVLATAPDEFLVAGEDVQITFATREPGRTIVGIREAETGQVRDGRWQGGRKLSGDDILLNYKIAEQAALNQSGSGLRFSGDGPGLQRVRLYRYE